MQRRGISGEERRHTGVDRKDDGGPRLNPGEKTEDELQFILRSGDQFVVMHDSGAESGNRIAATRPDFKNLRKLGGEIWKKGIHEQTENLPAFESRHFSTEKILIL